MRFLVRSGETFQGETHHEVASCFGYVPDEVGVELLLCSAWSDIRNKSGLR